MLSQIISTVVQIAILTLIPFLVFLIWNRTTRGFLAYIGLKQSVPKANWLAALGSLLFASPLLALGLSNSHFAEIMTAPGTVVGGLKSLDSPVTMLFSILLISIFKTALSEEIFFRGFVAKRLIAHLGYGLGNSLQAIIFGALHAVIFLRITSRIPYLVVIFVFPAAVAFLVAHLNEKVAKGSIIPGWIAHGLGNLLSNILLVYLT